MASIGLEKINNHILKDFDLFVENGHTHVILGPNGAGKTTILNVIAGIVPAHGKVFMNQKEITHLPPCKRKLGYLFQDLGLFRHLTVAENIAFGLKIKKTDALEINKKVDELLERFGITQIKNRYPKYLSGGEQQRAALARALACSPKALLMDEPFSKLDPSIKEPLERDFKKIIDLAGVTTIMVTHDIDTAFSVSNRISVVNKGLLLQTGTPEKIFRKPENLFMAGFIGENNIYTGTAEIIDQTSFFFTGGLKIQTVSDKTGPVSVSIRPDDILISTQPVKSSARNSFKGRVMKLENHIKVIELIIDAGVEIKSFITKQALVQMDIKPGSSVYVTFKASAVHVF
jgi:molybdopterin-binding protein